jgi:hypothetical protein
MAAHRAATTGATRQAGRGARTDDRGPPGLKPVLTRFQIDSALAEADRVLAAKK